MKKRFTLLIILIAITESYSQQLESFKAPVPSKVYEFTKYDQLPVGEYTGVPNISVPLYSIKVNDVVVPIALQYHAQGIRVSDEATHVGLGWNLNFGQITQSVNGLDDIDHNPSYDTLLLKYDSSDFISEWPGNINISGNYNCDDNFSGYNPSPPLTKSSTFIATNNNVLHPTQSFCLPYTDYAVDDLEPDIFRVNFFGVSLKFIKNFTTGNIEVLDNKGYKIIQDSTSGSLKWKVFTPNGDQYIFGLQKTLVNSSYSYNTGLDYGLIFPNTEANTSGGSSYTKVWQLTKIITNKNQEISFEYSDYGSVTSKSYSQKFVYSELLSINPPGASTIIPVYWKGYLGTIDTNALKTYIITSQNSTAEAKQYLTQISTNDQIISFSYSDRLDRDDKKLNSITVKNIDNLVIKEFTFGYDYFISSSSGNSINELKTLGSEPVVAPSIYNSYRLKLTTVTESGSNPYYFTYNTTTLPVKTSTAIDHWGFYNGKLSNTSIAANPVRLGYNNYVDNGNNNTAFINFTKAAVLEEIKFPTGGKAVYEYELNEYDNEIYDTNIANANDVVSSHIVGSGLRVKSISLFDNFILQKKTTYSYEGGKSIIPVRYFNFFTINVGQLNINQYTTRKVSEFLGQNYYSTNGLGSISGVGYNKVIAQEIGSYNKGKIVLYFHNNKDIKPSNLGLDYYNEDPSYGKMTLPTIENFTVVNNGEKITEEIWNGNNEMILKKEYNYIINKSSIFYGNKISGFRSIYQTGIGDYNQPYASLSQQLVGYYPIYGKHSLISSEKVTEYFPSGNKETTTHYSYNGNNVLTEMYKNALGTGEFYREWTVPTSNIVHINKNLLNLPVQKSIYVNGSIKEQYNYNYTENSGITVLSNAEVLPLGSPNPVYKKKTFYDRYDSSGNILEFHQENDIYTCVIWGYNNTLPIAKIDNIRYTSIESYVSGLQSASDNDETALLSALTNLRSFIASQYPEAQITTYTHKMLAGITSITDPRGEKTTYVYDAFNRLKEIRDNQNMLLESYKYHFKQ